MAAGAAAYALSGRDGAAPRAAPADADDPGPVHVHGLGVNPADGALFVATHTGLWRVDEDSTTAERVGGSLQDTMGFTVVGADHFLGSGHPDASEDGPPLLGLIESRDAGRTWDKMSLIGEADFHVLRASGRRVYGYDAANDRLLASSDGGVSWNESERPAPLADLVVHPRDPRRLVAAGEGGLYESVDAGRVWRKVGGAVGLLAWPSPERLYLVDAGGDVLRSGDDGRTWRRAGNVGGEPAAFLGAASSDLYVALHDGTIKRSTDGGRRWRVRSTP